MVDVVYIPYIWVLAFVLFVVIHLLLDGLFAKYCLRARGVERSKAELDYPFELPLFVTCSDHDYIGAFIREICFGVGRIVIEFALMVIALMNETDERLLYAVVASLISFLSLLVLLVFRVVSTLEHRRFVWAVFLYKRDLVKESKSEVLATMARVVRSILFLQGYLTIAFIAFFILVLFKDGNHSAIAALFAFEGLTIPVFLLYQQIYVSISLYCSQRSGKSKVSIVHPKFFYYSSNLTQKSVVDTDDITVVF
uniref:Uncharacterized protein n=1 Tax=Mucochytrium quahogii TaxID=96639 RepID=A0A7S2WC09_9STRA|mmetsp:Transcript_19081/g.31253  ORF Transcript_19081/g.31253 Transcript_19081/m.31253 type:complete len:253 (-) Transcript_19081:1075-1833(-)